MPRRKNVKNRKRVNKKKNYKGKRKQKYGSIQSVHIRRPGVVVADRTYIKFHYMDTTSRLLAAAGNPYGYIRYYANGLFDANPLILTSAIPGFTELASLYEQYRVHGAKITIRFVNQETFPSVVVIWPTDQDQTALITQQYLQEMCGNAFAKFRHVSSKGGMDRGVLSAYISFKKLVGTANYNTEADYASVTSTNPVKLMYWNIGTYSMDNSNYTAANVPFECRITFYAEMYNRRQLTS